MNLYTFLTIVNTIFIFGFIIGYSFYYFINKILKKKHDRENLLKDYEMAYKREQERVFSKTNIIKTNKKINQPIKHNICKCGHDKKEHILDYKKQYTCSHILNHISEDNDIICECSNYIEN